eukprot:COSAG02_NODE_909_length_16018_cov_15.571895_9_plen_126_part_00
MDSTVTHDELSSKLKLAVVRVISTALAGKKGRIIQYPFQFFRITHNLNPVALMMKFCSTWALADRYCTYARVGIYIAVIHAAGAERSDDLTGMSYVVNSRAMRLLCVAIRSHMAYVARIPIAVRV